MKSKIILQKIKNEPVFVLVMSLTVTATAFLILYPLLKVVLYPGLSDYAAFPGNRRWMESLANSVMMMALSMATCTLTAFLFAFAIVRLPVPCKKLFRFVTLLPTVSPPFIVALSYILLFGAQGLVSKKLLGLNFNIYGWAGLWVVQTVTFFPYAYTVVESVMAHIPENMEYAAGNLGAGRWRVFRDVFWPLCRPGVAGGAMMAAMNVLADFGNPMMIGGNMHLLSTEAYMQMVGQYDMKNAAVLSTALLIPTVAIFLADRYWMGRRSYVTVTGKESALPAMKVNPAVKWCVFGVCMAISLFVLAVYGVLAVGAFTKVWGYGWSLDLSHFAYVWGKRDLIVNSLAYAAGASILASAAGLALACLVQRRSLKLSRVIDFLAVLPGAIPGVFLGLGFSMAFGPPPFQLSGTALIMILALTVWNIPTCYSSDFAGLQQVGQSVEDAARNLGAVSGRSFRDILFPLLRQPVLSGLILSFLRSMTCLSVVIFLYSANTNVSTVSILSLVSSGDWSGAAAFTVVIIAISFAVTGLFQGTMKQRTIFRGNRRIKT